MWPMIHYGSLLTLSTIALIAFFISIWQYLSQKRAQNTDDNWREPRYNSNRKKKTKWQGNRFNSKKSNKKNKAPGPHYKAVRKVAVLVASKDGQGTIAATVLAASRSNVPVYVVSDGSTDATGHIAREAGASVLDLKENVGKPTALKKAYQHFKLGQRYDAVAILDDDVIVEDDFVDQTVQHMGPDTAISVGKNLTFWPKERRWNIFLAQRTYAYCLYQATIRRLQSALNVMNCISGSNSLYRTEVLDKVLTDKTPYIVDDTYWTLQVHRLGLGKIVYAPKARAWIQDPTNFQDWYKQNLRWLWGTMQGVIGHRIGSKATKFDLAYLVLIAEWVMYVARAPLAIWFFWHYSDIALLWVLLRFGAGYFAIATILAVHTQQWRLAVLTPAIIGLDYIYRALFVHGFLKALRQPRVESCTWESPTRLQTQEEDRIEDIRIPAQQSAVSTF